MARDPREYLFVNDGQAALAGGITGAQTALTVTDGSSLPAPGGGQISTLVLKDDVNAKFEVMHLTARTGNSLTVERAQEGTTGLTWSAGEIVRNSLTAGFLEKIRDNLGAPVFVLLDHTIAVTGGAATLSISLAGRLSVAIPLTAFALYVDAPNTFTVDGNAETTFSGAAAGEYIDIPPPAGYEVRLTVAGINPPAWDGVWTELTGDEYENLYELDLTLDGSTTLALLHFDDTDGSTSFVDSSVYGRTVTTIGAAEHDTAQSQFGGSAYRGVGGASAGVKFTIGGDHNFSTGDFSIDFWMRPDTSGSGASVLRGAQFSSLYPFDFTFTGSNNIRFIGADTLGSTAYSITSAASTIPNDTWTHIEAGRSGSTFYLFINGVAQPASGGGDNDSYAGSLANLTGPVRIGCDASENSSGVFDGWIDEVRITSLAPHTSDFTPPIEAYPAAPPVAGTVAIEIRRASDLVVVADSTLTITAEA